MWVLGFSGLYHDSAAALVHDDAIICAVQEERFTRIKHDASFPSHSIDYCLRQLPDGASLDAVVYYENPELSLDRVLQNSLQRAPRGGDVWTKVAQSMFGRKLNVGDRIRQVVGEDIPYLVSEHHLSHAASAFYPSPFDDAAILVADGVGEWATTTIAHGVKAEIKPLREIRYPHSLGLLYSAFTEYCGLKVNSGEYKLMGLAPYGQPVHRQQIYDNLLDLKEDGSFRLNTQYFGFMDGLRTTNAQFHKLFGGPPLEPGMALQFRHMDIAASIQSVINDVMAKLAAEALRLSGSNRLCLAGGVALNCVTNGHLMRHVSGLEAMWVQPAAGDAGGAIGAALSVAHCHLGVGRERTVGASDHQHGSLLGPAWTEEEVRKALDDAGLVYHRPGSNESYLQQTAAALAAGNIVGRFEGRMEFGPRALGNRSILADPRRTDAQQRINLKIKYRESWRPFAPAVLAHRAKEFFDLKHESPYMLQVGLVLESLRKPIDWNAFRQGGGDMLEFVNQERSVLPGITHVDYSARIQTVDKGRNPAFFALLSEFEKITGCPVLINTSFNVRGEPIVCTPSDAIECFLNAGLDALAIGGYIVWKTEQAEELQNREGAKRYAPD